MLRKFVSIFFFVCVVMTLVMSQSANAQCTEGAARTWVAINDNGAGRDTLWFGQDPAGTRGLNTGLCEIELPPPPPGGVFDARWMNPPGYEGAEPPAGLGQGVSQDYRFVTPSEPLDVDTFKVKFQPSDGGFPVTFNWSTSGIVGVCDSAWLLDEFGGVIFKVRMHVANSYIFTSPAFTTALIYRFGAKITDVAPINDLIPSQFGLQQNYPNPFNPSTTIQFAVERFAKTEVAVFDILGRKVATLVSEQLAPGFYSVNWNGKNDLGTSVSSGVYLLRMNAVGENNATFSAVRKLMLTK